MEQQKEIAHFFWKGHLYDLERSCINSFVRHNFEVFLWSYDGLELPGVISKDAQELLPEKYLDDLAFSNDVFDRGNLEKCKKSIFAGLIRLEILNHTNGWWFDTDCFCLKDQSEFRSLRGKLGFLVGRQDESYHASGIIYAEGEFAEELCKRGHEVVSRDTPYVWGDVGPRLMTKFAKDKHLENEMAGREMFYSISYDDTHLLTDKKWKGKGLCKIKDSYVTHVWHNRLMKELDLKKRRGEITVIHKNLMNNYSKNSLLVQLISENLPNEK